MRSNPPKAFYTETMAVESGFYSENLGFQDCSFHPFSLVDDHLADPQQTRTTSRLSSSSSSFSSITFSAMALLNSQLELQKKEIDFLLHFQKEKLRMALQEQRKQQVKAVISNLATEAWKAMREKEADLAEATRKARELEERLKNAEMEKEAWKRMANAKEAMVMGLNSKLEEATERQIMVSNEAEDAESHYPSEAEEEEEEESGGRRSGLACKSCKNRNLCVLFLPCKHLCSCKYCEAFLGCCPVCDSVKEACVEVLLV